MWAVKRRPRQAVSRLPPSPYNEHPTSARNRECGPVTATFEATRRAPDGLMDYDEAIERFDPVLGLEVHVELGTATKMFCGCPTDFGAEPNTQVCPICLAFPGAMPAVNRTAVEYAIRIGLALNCEIATWCRFARKNYFYPNMPKNFQTSQYDEPIATNGY